MATLNDYRRMSNAWAAQHPIAAPAEWAPVTPEAMVGGWTSRGVDWQGAEHERQTMEQFNDWLGSLTPEQRADYRRAADARNAKNLAITKGVAALFAAGVGGAALGGLGMGGAGVSAESLAAADIAGGLVPEFGSEAAYLSGLGAYGMPAAEATLPAWTNLDAGVMSGLGEAGWMDGAAAWGGEAAGVGNAVAGGAGLDGTSALASGLDSYYTGLGGVDGSIAGSGVSNPGFQTWAKSISPETLKNLGQLLGGTDSLMKGLYSLYQSNKFAKLGKGTPAQQTANTQLNALLQNPDQIYKMPGWEAGLEAVLRTGAGQGYLGSGNMMLALNKYGGDFYNNTVSQLNSIATGGQAVQAGYNVGSANLFGQGTNSLGYWMSRYGKSIFDMIGD